jgi:hypothetical protein
MRMKRWNWRQRAAFTAGMAVILAEGAMVYASVTSSAASEPIPHCQPVLIVTPWRHFTVHACDSGLRDPAPGKEWAWTVDGSALKGGAVIFGAQIPRQRSR